MEIAGVHALRTLLRLAIAVAVVSLFGLTASARAATVTVTSEGDSGAGSLREAVADADEGDTIDFDPNVQAIALTTGSITIEKSLTIAGPGASQLTIDAGHNSRIFIVTDGSLSISGVTLANGAAPTDGGAIYYTAPGALTVSESAFIANSAGGPGGVDSLSGNGKGGAIYVPLTAPSPTVSISESIFTANTAGGDGGDGSFSGRGEGGAIADYSGGTLTITGSTFVANAVGGAKGSGGSSGRGFGGAITAMGGGSLSVSTSTFTANSVGGQVGDVDGAGGSGGALSTWNRFLTVSGSTFSDNTVGLAGGSGSGGAIDAGAAPSLNASASISNSTLTGNEVGGGATGRGGAIDVADMSSATLVSATISANSVGVGGSGAGISAAGGVSPSGATVTARATIVSGNTGATNCDAPVAIPSFSLEGPDVGDTSCGFDLPSADPELAALDENGGPTMTQALTVLSPAFGAVPAAHCPTNVDQRGELRPGLGKSSCDVGAYELQGDPVAPQITSGDTASFQVGKAGSFTVTATGVPAPSLSKDGALPDGVAFTDNGDGTASLAGTPAAGTEGSHQIEIEADNGESPAATQEFTLMVAAPDPPIDPTEPPVCPASPLASVAPCPDDPPPGPSPPSPRPIALSLGVERKSLPALRRSGRLVVVARVNQAARLTLSGRARVRIGAGHSARTRLVAVFQRRTVNFGAPGRKRVALVLTRQGRRALRGLRRARLVIAGTARSTAGQTTSRRVALTMRR